MRTKEIINQNITDIHSAMRTLQNQITLLENEYQAVVIEQTGDRYEGWDEMKSKLQTAWDSLNQLWHMEADIEQEMRAEEIEREYERIERERAEME